MKVLLVSIVDSREDESKRTTVIESQEVETDLYLKPMVNLLKKSVNEEIKGGKVID